ncbi:phosphatase PAP2 family protein [Sphingomonas solaris]|uniref:Phosphatase PAP2 family protein n=1 Tax=Alterirhizorhabdus solaris TaxID=2529389 RepID=A0A558R679_9SPHN|nr:phosphatase PAP2 family protein [Sphingomonas solaris]
MAGGFRLAWGGIAPSLGVSAGLAGLARFYTATRPDPRLAAATNGLALLIAFTALAAPLSYVVASVDLPLADAMLLRRDRALGFDWVALIAFVNARPLLAALLGLAYQTLLPQIAVAIVALSFSGRTAALRRVIAAMMIAGIVAIALSPLVPAVGNYVFLHLPPAAYAGIDPSAGFVHLADFTAVRNGTLHVLTVNRLQGIITFPSYHASLGVLLGWAFWQMPRLRWPGLALETALIVATPVHGAHYLVDVLAGGAIAAASLGLATRWLGRDAPAGAGARFAPALA